MRSALRSGLVLLGVAVGGQAATAQPYDNDNWSAAYAARWALDAFQPVDRPVVWRSDIKLAVVTPQEGVSVGQQAQAELRALIGAIDFRHKLSVPNKREEADFVICVGEVKNGVNGFCDGVYLAAYRILWHPRNLTMATPEPPLQGRYEDTPALDRCSFFVDAQGTIRAAFISLSLTEDKAKMRNCLMQGLGLSFWRIEAFFKADYSTDENKHGIRGHELSLLKAGYWVDRLGCAKDEDRQACFGRYIDRAEAERAQKK